MPNPWNSLYLTSADVAAVADALRAALVADGLQPFDPFTGMPAPVYPRAVRAFVAAPRDGWTRVLSETAHPDWFGVLQPLAADVLAVAWEPDNLSVRRASSGGGTSDMGDTFTSSFSTSSSSAQTITVGGVPMSALPDDVQGLAGRVTAKDAQGMFGRLARQFNVGNSDAANALVQGASFPDWAGADGARVLALLAEAGVPGGYHLPDFVTVRDAYALHRRRERNPNARLYPGDAEVLAAVPDVAAYLPLYYGGQA